MNKQMKRREVARIQSVKPLDGFTVHPVFTDGTEKDIDLEPFLHGPIFAPMRKDLNVFRQVYVDPLSETLTWPKGADMAPDVWRYNLTPAWMEEQRAHAAV